MSRAVGNPTLGPFLQERVKAFLSEKNWTQREFAHKAGISTAQVSDLINKAAGVGYMTARKVGRVLGYSNLGDLETAAEEWVVRSGRIATKTEPPARRPQRLLRQRDEWDAVVREVMEEKPYLPEDSFTRVGRLQDNEADFPDPLPPSLVADLAHAFFAAHSKRTGKKQ